MEKTGTLGKIKRFLISKDFRFLILSQLTLYNHLSDEDFLKRRFKAKLGYDLDLDDPKTFNAKLQWLKLHDRNPNYTQMVDKYEVRKFISERIGSEFLVPLLGVWDKFEDIEFSELPRQFVLKCTHDSGGLVICKDKPTFDKKAAQKKINARLKRNYFYHGREWPYKDIKPRIIAEKYMEDESGGELKDYKFLCFNGEVKCLFVCLNRNTKAGLNVDFYDIDWTPMPFERHYKSSGTIIPKPKSFDKMMEFAHKLSYGIPFVRIDFYDVDGHLYMGEMTFYPGSGCEEFDPEEWDYTLGGWLHLPQTEERI